MLTALILLATFPIVYVYALYPALLLLSSRLAAPTPEPSTLLPLPSVSLVVPAHNEQDVIAAKVANCRALDYPDGRLEIVIASDGSTDATVTEARRAADGAVRIVEFASRRGKTTVLNEIIPALSGEIIVQSDANSELDRDALLALVRSFSDPRVGCAVGQLVLSNRDDPRVSTGEGLYWSYENRLKIAESRLGTLVTANGGIYAFRKALFMPLPQHLAGDAADPLLIASRGHHVVFAPRAIAREKASESLGEEFQRKVRIMTQGLSAWIYVRGMLAPLRPKLAFALFSHKLLRWLLPWFLALLFVLSAVPGAPPWARAFGLLQAAFYALALVGLVGGAGVRRVLPIGIAAYFCMANAAAALATLNCLAGRRYSVWEKSATSR